MKYTIARRDGGAAEIEAADMKIHGERDPVVLFIEYDDSRMPRVIAAFSLSQLEYVVPSDQADNVKGGRPGGYVA